MEHLACAGSGVKGTAGWLIPSQQCHNAVSSTQVVSSEIEFCTNALNHFAGLVTQNSHSDEFM